MPEMTETALKGLLQARIQGSLGYLGGRLAKERLQAYRYFQREPFGNEQEGRSKVVTGDVAESIDELMPSLVRVFCAGDQVVLFQPTRPEEDEAAEQASDYCNHIVTQKLDWYSLFHDWAMDALLQRLGVIKVWWEDKDESERETYKDLTDLELQALVSDPAVAVIEATVRSVAAGAEQQDATQGAGSPPSAALHDVVVARTAKSGCIRAVNVPPDEFLTDRRVSSLDDAGMMAHRRRMTRSELIAAGFDKAKVNRLPSNDAFDLTMERQERFQPEDELPWRDSSEIDPSTQQIWVTEVYIKVDYDGDGIAEWRQITVAGDATFEILKNEECDGHPFCVLTPFPLPHKLFGRSVADLTMDLQKIKSTVMRLLLDNLYLGNNSRMAVNPDNVTIDDLLTVRPGGIVRTTGNPADSIVPLQVPTMGPEPYQLLTVIDQMREVRTGVKRVDPALTPNAIADKSATEAALMANAGRERVEMIARTFAETGVKQLFRRVLELVCKYQNKPDIIRLRGQWVPMDPSQWSTKFGMTVSVGLGTGDRTQEAAAMMQMIGLTQSIIQFQQGLGGPLVSAKNAYNQLKTLVKAMQLRDVEQYFSDPESPEMQQAQQQQQQKPDPKQQELQMKMQLQQQQQQADLQHQQAKAQLDAQLEREKTQRQAEREAAQAQADLAVQQQKAQLDLETARQKAALELQLRREEAQLDMELKRRGFEMQAAQQAKQPAEAA